MSEQTTAPAPTSELIALDELHPHPRNYRAHPDDELAHIESSLRSYGIYRNVVVARDGTILAGHGVVEVTRRMGLTHIPAIRLDLGPDEPRALRILTGDNEIARLAEVDDRALTEILRELGQDIDGLLGTGFDEQMLANLVFVTRPASEIRDPNEAAAWLGLPEFMPADAQFPLMITCESAAAREELVARLGEIIYVSKRETRVWSARYPPRPRQDLTSLRFE